MFNVFCAESAADAFDPFDKLGAVLTLRPFGELRRVLAEPKDDFTVTTIQHSDFDL
jgi:hypothetical protein